MLRFTELRDDGKPPEFQFDYPGNDLDEARWFAEGDHSELGKFVRGLIAGTSPGNLHWRTDILPN